MKQEHAKDYHLPNCLVLWAAVFATKRAVEFAKAMLPAARAYEGQRK